MRNKPHDRQQSKQTAAFLKHGSDIRLQKCWPAIEPLTSYTQHIRFRRVHGVHTATSMTPYVG